MSVTTIKSSVVKQSLYRLVYTEIKKEGKSTENHFIWNYDFFVLDYNLVIIIIGLILI